MPPLHHTPTRPPSGPTPDRRAPLAGLLLLIASILCVSACRDVGPTGVSEVALVPPAAATALVETSIEPFGRYRGRDYLIHRGRFEGTTSLGAFRVPWEMVAPAVPASGNGALLFEPPHFTFGPLGRDLALGREFLFERGYAWASVGFGANGLNLLDPAADDAVLKGEPVEAPGTIRFGLPPDEEILIQFVELLVAGGAAERIGPVERWYAYGASQTAGALLETYNAPGGAGLFDFTLLEAAIWQPFFALPDEFERLNGPFTPPPGIDKVILVESEADLILGETEQFRQVGDLPGWRIWEVAGAAHLPSPSNPLEHQAVARAALVAGDAWVRLGAEPPPTLLLEEAPPGQVDPVYGLPTGIARDADGNAHGGVRLPDLAVGRGQYIAVDLLGNPLGGLFVDLACAAASGEPSGEPRLNEHGAYVMGVARQSRALREGGYLLSEDAIALIREAAVSDVGKPWRCDR
ncbi:MAG TPA: alpha/beta hydrolase domain-containing protein [Longimicrobiales bacterium]|nr:alpha/beta hydrolase domain-containing protein [Longimicrobiales bacterium]